MIKPKLHELVASRICHDLISPIGACANGAELMAMGGGAPEVALVEESAADAVARVRFFRIAFGQADGRQHLSSVEMAQSFAALSAKKIEVTWRAGTELPRKEAQAICLALLCVERALPRGGAVTIKALGTHWSVSAEAENLLITDPLWSPLTRGVAPEEVIPATVSFALLPDVLQRLGRRISIQMTDSRILMQF